MRNTVKRSQELSLRDATHQYARFRELAKKLFAASQKERGERLEEGKDQQQKKSAAT